MMGPNINNYSIKCTSCTEKCNKDGIFKTLGSHNINNRLNPIENIYNLHLFKNKL